MSGIQNDQAIRRLARRPDVVVVGAGIVGLAAAYELAARRLRVCVLDGAEPGAGQSSRNWGFIRQHGRTEEELPVMIEANGMWQELPGRLGADIEWVQGGNLRLTDQPQRAEEYRRWIDLARSYGLDSRVATPAEVTALVPGFTARYELAIFTPSDGQANPVKAVGAYTRALGHLQVDIHTGRRAQRIVTAADTVVGVATDGGFVAAPTVVLAAGTGTGALLRQLGHPVPVHFVDQTVALTEPMPKLTDACVWTGRVGFRQTANGQVLVSSGGLGDLVIDTASLGALLSPRQLRQAIPMYWKNRDYLRIRPRQLVGSFGPRRRDHLDGEVRYDDVAQALNAMAEHFPALRWQPATAWAGTIDGTPDALPILDTVGPGGGVVVASGMSGHGFGLAPAVGRIVADLITTGTSHHDLRPFRLRRFVDGTLKPPQHLL